MGLSRLLAGLLAWMGRALAAAGVVACLAALCFAGALGVGKLQAEWAGRDGRDVPTDRAGPRREPRRAAVSPSVRLFGPTECVAGAEYYFVCEVAGTRGKPAWEIDPPGGLRVSADGLRASFRSAEAGRFALHVAVGGSECQVATDQLAFENLEVQAEGELEPIDAPTVAPVTAAAPPVAELVAISLTHVHSTERDAQARIVAGSIRSVCGRVSTGLLPPDADVVGEIAAQMELALGHESAQAAWLPFAEDLRTIVALSGATTAAGAVPVLNEVAAVLGR